MLEWLANNYKKFGCVLEFVTDRSEEVRLGGIAQYILHTMLGFLLLHFCAAPASDWICDRPLGRGAWPCLCRCAAPLASDGKRSACLALLRPGMHLLDVRTTRPMPCYAVLTMLCLLRYPVQGNQFCKGFGGIGGVLRYSVSSWLGVGQCEIGWEHCYATPPRALLLCRPLQMLRGVVCSAHHLSSLRNKVDFIDNDVDLLIKGAHSEDVSPAPSAPCSAAH